MTVRASPRDRWRSALPALAAAFAVALTGIGHASWWMPIIWSAGLWVMRTSTKATQVNATMPLVLALIGALPWWPEWLPFTAKYLQLALIGTLMNITLARLEERSALGLLFPLVIWLFAPTPVGLFGLVVTAAVFGHASLRTAHPTFSPRAAAAVLLFAAIIASLSAVLVAPGDAIFRTLTETPDATQRRADVSNPVQSAPPPSATPAESPGSVQRSPTLNSQLASPLLARRLQQVALFVLGAFALLLIVVYIQVRKARVRRQPLRPHWSDLVALLGVASLAVAFSMYVLISRGPSSTTAGSAPGMGGGPAQPLVEGSAVGTSVIGAVAGWAVIATMGFAVLVLLLATRLLLLKYPAARADEPGVETAAAFGTAASVPDHRVRRAYRLMLVALAEAGTRRQRRETPQEYAARAGEAVPAAAGDIDELTGLYEPVRYGQEVAEAHAGAAEAAAARIESVVRRAGDAR